MMEQDLIEEIAKIINSSTEIDTMDYYKARVKAKEILDYFDKSAGAGEVTLNSKGKSLEKENEKLKADSQVLEDALRYMAGMYGFRLDMNKYDDEIEYSCNQYVTDRETWLTLKKAEKIIDWWE